MLIEVSRSNAPVLRRGYVPADTPLPWLNALSAIHERAVFAYEGAERALARTEADIEEGETAHQAAIREAVAARAATLPSGPEPAAVQARRLIAETDVCHAAFALAHVAETVHRQLRQYRRELLDLYNTTLDHPPGVALQRAKRTPYLSALLARLEETKGYEGNTLAAVMRFREAANAACLAPDGLRVPEQVEQEFAAIRFPHRAPIVPLESPTRGRKFDQAHTVPRGDEEAVVALCSRPRRDQAMPDAEAFAAAMRPRPAA